MTNIFAQKIGIWYKDKDWCEKMFPQVLSSIPEEAIAKVMNSRYEKIIILKDESIIRFISASDYSRGQMLTKSYIQEGITYNVYRTIICPCIKPIFSESIVVDTFEDFYNWKQANKYYWMDKEKTDELYKS